MPSGIQLHNTTCGAAAITAAAASRLVTWLLHCQCQLCSPALSRYRSKDKQTNEAFCIQPLCYEFLKRLAFGAISSAVGDKLVPAINAAMGCCC